MIANCDGIANRLPTENHKGIFVIVKDYVTTITTVRTSSATIASPLNTANNSGTTLSKFRQIAGFRRALGVKETMGCPFPRDPEFGFTEKHSGLEKTRSSYSNWGDLNNKLLQPLEMRRNGWIRDLYPALPKGTEKPQDEINKPLMSDKANEAVMEKALYKNAKSDYLNTLQKLSEQIDEFNARGQKIVDSHKDTCGPELVAQLQSLLDHSERDNRST